jgi:predicted nucleic acid-binding protein
VALVVSDTSPIRALVHLGLQGVLAQLFGRVLIPPAVLAELAASVEGFQLQLVPALELREPTNTRSVEMFRKTLDPGESEALALALEIHAEAVLIDEADGRAAARTAGLQPVGVLGVLLRSKERGLCGSVKPLMDSLVVELDFFISQELRRDILQRAGES